jgi:predicted aconitase with swiveling domain
MSEEVLKGRCVYPGSATGEAVVLKSPFSFLGELSSVTGQLSVADPDLNGASIVGKILVCPTGKGSSGGPTVAWLAKQAGNAPLAVVCTEIEPVLALGVITAEIPAVDRLDKDPVVTIHSGDLLTVEDGSVRVVHRSR